MPIAPPSREGAAAGPVVAVALAAAAFAVLHSLLASRHAKHAAERLVGPAPARGGYRLAYNGVAVASTLALTAYVLRRRGPFVYDLRGPAAALVRAGQLAALGVALRSAIDAGLPDLSGIGPAWRWAIGAPLGPIPDGQGPAERAPGVIAPVGPFAHTRNPLNVYAIPVLWLAPRATAARLAVNAVLSAYCIVGSYHADAMLRARHGAGWREYAARVPVVVPAGVIVAGRAVRAVWGGR